MTTTSSSWPNPQPPAPGPWQHGPGEPDWHHGPGGWPHGPGAPVFPPVLLAVVPPTGPAAGGTQVTLLGLGFSGATAVRFGLTPASSFTVASDNIITAVAPPGVGITVVTVTNSHGTSNGFPYIYAGAPTPPPVITSLVPSSGPIVGGTTVIITGSGFTSASAVSFGATPATSFTVLSDTSITAVAPAGTGTVPVTVTTPGGTSNPVSYTYAPVVLPPVITSLVPNLGPLAGGTTVIITGSGFTSASAVSFGATPATSFTVLSDTSITAVAPAGTGTVSVTVTAPGGTSNAASYTYVPPPVITSLTPVSGPIAGGTVVTITGSGFTSASAVSFGATPATSFTVLSDTSITAVAPAGTGTVSVTVTAPAGTSNVGTYTYV